MTSYCIQLQLLLIKIYCAVCTWSLNSNFLLLLLQELANKAFSFPRGQELPALCPVKENKDKKQSSEDEEEEKGLTDAEQLKQDVIKVCIIIMWKKGLPAVNVWQLLFQA